MGKEKFDKHKLREDELIAFLKRVILYVRCHPRQIKASLIVAGGFIVSCIVLYIVISNVRVGRIEEFEKVADRYFQVAYTESVQDLQGAADALKQFIERYKRGKEVIVARYYLGCCLVKLQRYKQARQVLQDFPKASPLKPYVLECIAHTYEKTSNYSAAVQFYQKIIDDYSQAPNYSSALMGVGRCWEKLGNFDKAKESYIKLITFHRDSAWFEDAKAYLDALP